MIEPTEQDIGRKVIYHPGHGAKPEEGVIAHLAGGDWVFVRYGSQEWSQKTPLSKLEWKDEDAELERARD